MEPIEKQPIGRPLALIDWDKVDSLLIAGCSGAEVAGHLGLSKKTIYERCVVDKGVTFTEYSQQKKSKGDSLIKAHRFAKALGKTNEGDNTLLIWLSKVRLGEKEPKHEENTTTNNTYYVNYDPRDPIPIPSQDVSASDSEGSA